MNLMMIGGDRSILQGKKGAFWNTLSELSKHFQRIDVICPRGPRIAIRTSDFGINVQDVIPGTPFSNVFFHPNPRALWYQGEWIYKKGSEIINTSKPGAMTVHEYPPFYNGAGAEKLMKTFNIPSLFEIHHIVGDPVPSSITEWIGLWMSRLFLARNLQSATAVRTVNHRVRNQLVSWGVDEKKVHVIHSFYLDRQAFESISPKEKTYDIAFAGRLVANKGWKELLQAVQELPGITCQIFGDGPDRGSIEKEIEARGLKNRVTIRGWMPTQESLWEAINEAKIFVMPSKSEGGPRIALEAMAMGMPVLATAVGVMPEAIENRVSGLLTKGTPEDLAEKIGMLLSDNALRERLGTAARGILSHFEKTAAIKAYADFIKSLATPKP